MVWPSGTSVEATDPLVIELPSIYDYGEAPPPDGEEPLEAVEAFFGDGVPEDAELEIEGLEVHVLQDARTVAIIGLLSVPGGYVVESYDACEGVIRG